MDRMHEYPSGRVSDKDKGLTAPAALFRYYSLPSRSASTRLWFDALFRTLRLVPGPRRNN